MFGNIPLSAEESIGEGEKDGARGLVRGVFTEEARVVLHHPGNLCHVKQQD